MNRQEYTRRELISICESSFVDQEKWGNRDSAESQIKLGSCLALLKAGCRFELQYTHDGKGCSTNEDTIWLQFWVKDFEYFEYGGGKDGNDKHDYHFYIPTRKRLMERKGRDWY